MSSLINIVSITASGNTTPSKIDLKTLQDSSLNGGGGFVAEAGIYSNAFFVASFDKVYHFTHVEIGRWTMEGQYSFMPTTTLEIAYNEFEPKSTQWTDFKIVELDEEPSAITTIPLNFSAKNIQIVSAGGDTFMIEAGQIRFYGVEDAATTNGPKKDAAYYAEKVKKESKEVATGPELTLIDHSKVKCDNFKQEGDSSIVITTPDLSAGRNRERFVTALQQHKGTDNYQTWLILNDIVFVNPTQSPLSVTSLKFEYLNKENQWISFNEPEAGRNQGGFKDVYDEKLKQIVKVHTFEIQNWEWFNSFNLEPGVSRSLHVQGFVNCQGKVRVLDYDLDRNAGHPPRRRVPLEHFPQPLTVRVTLNDSLGKSTQLKIQQLNLYPDIHSEEKHRELHKLRKEDFVIVCDDDFNKERVFVQVRLLNSKLLYIQVVSRYNSNSGQVTLDQIRNLESKKLDSKIIFESSVHKVKAELLFDKENKYKTYGVKISLETATNSVEKVVPVVEIIEKLVL